MTATLRTGSALSTPIRRSRTVTSRVAIDSLAAVLNGEHAQVGGSLSCPVRLPQYRLSFAPVTGGPPVVVSLAGCWGDQVSVAGRRQPMLSDPMSGKLFPVIARVLGVHARFW